MSIANNCGALTRRRLAGAIHWHTYTMTSGTNRLASDASTGASTLSFFYDANGARTLEDYAGGPHPWKQYYYDGLGRTTGVKYWTEVLPFGVQYAGGSDQCRYDPDGQMIKPCDNWSTFLAYDGSNVVGRPGLANDGRATFVHGPGLDDPLLGVVRFQNDAKELMWVTDGSERQYAVGGIGGHDPASIAPNIDFSGSSGYWGWQWVGGTKRSHGFTAGRQSPAGSAGAFSVFRNRLYDPATGRWTQEDPIRVAGGVNLYQFNGNNPATYTDPFGFCPGCVLAAAALGAAGSAEAATLALGTAAIVATSDKAIELNNAVAGAAATIVIAGALNTVEVAGAVIHEARSLKAKAKEVIAAILIGLGGGKTDIEPQPPRPPTQEQKPKKKKEKDKDGGSK